MLALRIARGSLLVSALIYMSTLLMGFTKMGDPNLLLPVAECSAIALVVSAAACVALQGYVMIQKRRMRS
jgi:hypothetical protein